MQRNRLSCLMTLLVVLAGATSTTASARPANRPAVCPVVAPVDLLCRSFGTVAHAGPTESAAAPTAVTGSAVTLPTGSLVKVGPNSLATLTFGRQAQCAAGLDGRATELVTRFTRSLYWQRAGKSRCTFTGRQVVGFFCGDPSIPDCPATMTTSGRVQAIANVPTAARTSQIPSSGPVRSETITLDFCSGAWRVDIEDASSSGSVSGGSTVTTNGVTTFGRSRATITKTTTSITTDTGTTESYELSLSSSSVVGLGGCRDRVFAQQRRWADGI